MRPVCPPVGDEECPRRVPTDAAVLWSMPSTVARTSPASAPVSAPVSALPRPLDLSYGSNRVAVFGTAVFGGMGLLLGRSWRQALGVGGVALLGWATGRELDPDAPVSAAVALGLAGLTGLAQTARSAPSSRSAHSPRQRGTAVPAILPGMAALSAARLLTGTVGYAATRPDVLALGVQAGAASLAGHQVAALLPAAALGLSAAQGDTLRPHDDWGTALALGAGLLPQVAGAASARRHHVLSDLLTLGALSLGRTLTAAEQPTSRCDRAELKVSASRLRSSRIMGLGALAAGLLRGESAGLVPLAAACLGAGLRRTLTSRSEPGRPELGHPELGALSPVKPG